LGREFGAEWFADAIVHTTGFAAGLIACLVLVFLAVRRARGASHPALKSSILLGLGLYGLGLLAMLTCSALYNLNVDNPHRELLRRFDHAAIFVMIAGTITPFALLCVRGAKGFKMFAAVWAIAGVGIALKFAAPAQFEVLSIPAYLLLGWAVFLVYKPLREAMPYPGPALLAVGCALYTIGTVVYMWNGIQYQLAIWHLFVLVATACHYTCIIGYAAGPTVLSRASIAANRGFGNGRI
jgi:hemolysin III